MYREALRLDPTDWDAKANLEALASEHPQADASRPRECALKPVEQPGGRSPATGSATDSGAGL
jgi:hypothetical protein